MVNIYVESEPTNTVDNQPADSAAGKLYGLAVSIYNPDASQTYLMATSNLSEGELDVRGRGLELPGFLFPFSHGNAIYFPNDDAPTITRYQLGAEDALEEGLTLSFAAKGDAAARDSFNLPVVHDEKAYAFDAANSVAHVWNPSTMALIDEEVDISIIQRDGYVARIAADSDSARRDGNMLFVPVGWEEEITEGARPISGMLVIDTDRDEVVKFLEDERCTEFQPSVRTSFGDLYFFTSEHSIVTISACLSAVCQPFRCDEHIEKLALDGL